MKFESTTIRVKKISSNIQEELPITVKARMSLRRNYLIYSESRTKVYNNARDSREMVSFIYF